MSVTHEAASESRVKTGWGAPVCPEKLSQVKSSQRAGPPTLQVLTLGVGLGRFHVTLRIHSVAVASSVPLARGQGQVSHVHVHVIHVNCPCNCHVVNSSSTPASNELGFR